MSCCASSKTANRMGRYCARSFVFPMIVLLMPRLLPLAACLASSLAAASSLSSSHHEVFHGELLVDEVQNAVDLLVSLGVPRENLCTVSSSSLTSTPLSSLSSSSSMILPPCITTTPLHYPRPHPEEFLPGHNPPSRQGIRSRRQLQQDATTITDIDDSEDDDYDSGDKDHHDRYFYITHALCALACVTTAALAAGLTMGLLSLDPLLLLIKVRAGATQKEQEQAAALLPIVKQHHLLLVTLLLLNSMANEALPLFLEVLVSPVVAVILSVTLVLFFGEIIPSAIFTGPNKVEIASKMVPVVKLVMFLLWPLAFPIAKLLDHVLHDDDDTACDTMFGRGEISALVRIQYEERLAYKKRHKNERESMRVVLPEKHKSLGMVDNVGALDFASTQAIKASKKTVDRIHSTTTDSSTRSTTNFFNREEAPLRSNSSDDNDPILTSDNMSRSSSIHVDEVSMVEGALSMKTKMALDVYTPIHRMVSIPYDMILNEHNMVSIYSRGYSRIPVFKPNPAKPKSVTAICGVLLTKQLIVLNPNEGRPLSTLPLSRPTCVSPKMNLIDLVNLFQTGRAGHLALVCARPQVGQEALNQGKALPEAAGLMGIITLEDVIEALLQEQIYDESDKEQREANRIARWAAQKWKVHVRRRKRDRAAGLATHVSMGTVVEQAIHHEVDERTRLVGTNNDSTQNPIFNPFGDILNFFKNKE